MTDEQKFYDIAGQDLVPRPLSEAEVAALLDMFDHDGWKVFIEMRSIDAQESVESGMDVASDSVTRGLWRAKYQGCKKDIEFEPEMRQAIAGETPVPMDELISGEE